MEHHPHTDSEISFHHEPAGSTKRIWKTFWYLVIITIIELLLGLLMYAVKMPDWVVFFIKGVIVILTLAKAFYIIAVFMHLGDEIRNLIMTIAIPTLLFIWFIAAFLWDGNSYRTLRNTYDTHSLEQLDREVRSNDTTIRPLD